MITRVFDWLATPANYIMLLGANILAPVVVFINKYVFDDWHFVLSLIVLVGVDTALGVYKAWRLNCVSSASFGKIFNKLAAYCAVLIATHAAAHLQANGKAVSLLTWLDGLVYAAIVVREFISILEKAGALGVAVPGWLLKRLRDFDAEGKFQNPNTNPN